MLRRLSRSLLVQLLTVISAATGTVIINTSHAIAEVDAKYVSVTIDASQYRSLDLTNPTLVMLAGALAPAVLRVGGTQADYDVYQVGDFQFDCKSPPAPMTSYRCKLVTEAQWRSLLNFSSAANLSLVFGLNDLFGRPTKTKPETKLCSSHGCPDRNQSNLEALLRWTVHNVPEAPIIGWELGNELNSCLNGVEGAKAQAEDFKALRKLISEVYNSSHTQPLIVGPDTHSSAEFSSEGREWFGKFVESAAGAVDTFTFHMYSMGDGPKLNPSNLNASFLNSTALDHSGGGVRALAKALPEGTPLWAGETAAANNGGQSGITDSYVDGFWYLDQLGSLARAGVRVFCRQTLESSGGYPLIEKDSPLPDYWVALLWSRIMGPKVLSVTAPAQSVRLYAHCTRDVIGAVSIAWLNIGAESQTLDVSSLGPATLWVLTPGAPMHGAVNGLQSQQVLLNEKLLKVLPGPALPTLAGVPSDHFTLPAASYGFALFADAGAPACGA